MMPSKVASANFMSVRLAPSTTTASGIPRPSLGLAALGSPLAAIGRIGAGRGSTERGLGHHPIHALPFPGNAFQFVIFLESRLPDALKHALLFPQPKAIIDRRRSSQFPWQGIPLDTRAQHIQDGRQHLPILLGGPSSLLDEGHAPGSTGAHAPIPQR